MPGPENDNDFVVLNPTLSTYGQVPTAASYETSRYDKDFVIPETDLGIALQGMRAENQGLGMELATAGANLVPNIALSMVENAGYLFDLEDWSNMIQNNKANYGNALTEWASRNKNQFGEVYKKSNDGGFDISDSAWWVSNGAGLVESLAAYGLMGYGVGTALSKGATGLTKALGAYGKGKSAIEGAAQLGTSLTLAYSEGAMTGAQVYKDVYSDTKERKRQEIIDQGIKQYGEENITEEYLKYADEASSEFATGVAGEAATKAVRINTGVNTFLNLPETGVLFRSMSSSRYMDDALKLQRGELAKDAVERLKTFDADKYLTKQAIRHKVKETGSEMLEEMVNVYAEEEGKNVGREATGQDVKTLGDMLADDDIWAAGFWGAIGGSMNGFVMGKMPKWVTQEDGTKVRTTVGAYNKEQVSAKYEEQLTDLQDRLTDFISARDELDRAAESGDIKAHKEASDKIFSYNSFNSIVKGTEEQLLNDYENILNLTPEEAAQQGFASDYKQRAAEKIQSVKQNTAEWNKLQDRHASQDLDQAGFPETIFQQHINVQNNRKIIEENTIELAKLEAEIAQINTLRGTDLTVTSFNDVESSIKAVEHAFEMATIDLENILNLDKFDNRTQKRIIAKLSNMYGNITNARTQIEEHLNELREKREDLDNNLEIQKANFYSFIDPNNTMSDQEKFDKYRDVVVQNSIDIDALAEGKKTLEENKKILASQIEELRVLKSDKGLERFKQLKKEKMAEREALDAQAAVKAREQAEAKAEADRIAAINNKKKVAPETVTPEEEEIIETAAPVESFEEGNYSGEGSSLKELEKQYDDISDEANNSDVDGEVRDSSDNLISVGDRLISGSNKLAYASTVEYTEDASGIKHISLKLNPETNPNLLTDAYVPGTKLKIKKLTAAEFKPFVAEKEISFTDEVGRRILVANAGTTVTFAMLDHPYMQPIGIYNEAGEYQAMLHAVSYITPNRIVPENVDVDLQTLINIRAAVTDQFQDITINSKSNGKINQLPKFYTLSELIDQPVEFAIATSSIQLNTSKTTPVENLANKKGYKVGQVYAITVMPDGRKVAIPVKTTKIKETPQVVTELMSALDTFLKGGTRQDLQNTFGQYLNSVFSSDKLTEDGNSFKEDPNGKDRFYIDFTSTNVDGVIFGRAGGSKYFINSKVKDSDLQRLRNELASIIQESYVNINFETLKNPDFVKKYVTSNVRFYPLPNGKVTVFDNPVIGFDTSTLISATAPSASQGIPLGTAPSQTLINKGVKLGFTKEQVIAMSKEERDLVRTASSKDDVTDLYNKYNPPAPITELERLNNEVIRLVNIRNNDKVVRQAINDSNNKKITLEELDAVMKKWDDENGLTAAIQAYDAEKRKQAPPAPVVTPTTTTSDIEAKKADIVQTYDYKGKTQTVKKQTSTKDGITKVTFVGERSDKPGVSSKSGYVYGGATSNLVQQFFDDYGVTVEDIAEDLSINDIKAIQVIEERTGEGITAITFRITYSEEMGGMSSEPMEMAVKKQKFTSDAELVTKTNIETEIKDALKNLVLPSGIKPYENTNIQYELEVSQESKNVAKLLSESKPLTFEFLKDNLGAIFTTNDNNVVTVSLNKGTGNIELSEENTVRSIIVNKDSKIDYDFENRGKELDIKNARAISQAETKYQKYVKDIINKYNRVQPTTQPTATTKAEIERKLKEEIISLEKDLKAIKFKDGSTLGKMFPNWSVEAATFIRESFKKAVTEEDYNKAVRYENLINHFDAVVKNELNKLTPQPTPAVETPTIDVKADIENRRQEALNKKDPQSGELLKENSISKQVLKEREGVNSFINASKGLNIDVDDIKIAAKLDNSFTSLPSNIQELLWEGKTEEALKEIGKTYEEEINDKYDIELARELYKEMKAGKIVTEFTPAEQEILYNPTILTQELKDSVDAELAAKDIVTDVGETTIYYGDYTIYKGEDGTYDVQHNEGDGIVGEYLSTKEEAIAIADRHKKQLENKPTEPITLTSASGIGFEIEELDEDDYSVTTAEQIEKSVSLQDKVNTLIQEGKATKFCK